MRPVGPGETSRIKQEQNSSMADTFVIGVQSEAVDGAGRLTRVYTDGSPKYGSLMNPTGKFADEVDKIIEQYDAILRTDVSTILPGDRVSFIIKSGTPDGSDTYFAATGPIRYRTMILYALRLVMP